MLLLNAGKNDLSAFGEGQEKGVGVVNWAAGRVIVSQGMDEWVGPIMKFFDIGGVMESHFRRTIQFDHTRAEFGVYSILQVGFLR